MTIPPTRAQGDSGHIQDHNDISTELSARLPLSGGTLTGTLNGTSATFSGTVTAATPTANGHLATKQYVDSRPAGLDALTKAYTTTINANIASNIVPYGATYTSGSFVGSTSSFVNVVITLPSGKFSATPIAMVSTTQQGIHVSGGASSATSVYTTVQNFSGWPGTNSGGTYGPIGTFGSTIPLHILAVGV